MVLHARTAPAAAVFVLVCAWPGRVMAQNADLRLPTLAASAAAAADWATTYHGLKNYELREVNPLLRPLDRTPGRLVSVGAIIDVGAVSAWNVTLGRDHPKIAAAGLWGMTAFRAYLAFHNWRNVRRAAKIKPGLISQQTCEIKPGLIC